MIQKARSLDHLFLLFYLSQARCKVALKIAH